MAALLDLRKPILADLPPVWGNMRPEDLALLSPKNGIYTPAQAAMLNRIAAARWFLLRNNGPHGESWRCGRCHAIHPFFTLSCQPVPMNGLTQAIGLLAERIGRELVFSALEIGTIEPIDRDYALKLYERLRGLGYQRQQILGM